MTGIGQGAHFTRLSWAREQFIGRLGVDPWPGTLNLRLEAGPAQEAWTQTRNGQEVRVFAPDRQACDARCLPVRIGGFLPGAVVSPELAGYPTDQIEVISAVNLREHLGLHDGDEVEISGAEMPDIRAVVFDVDGTLVNSIEGMRIAAARAAAIYGYEVPLDAVRRALNFGESLWHLIMPTELHGDRELPAILHMETMRHWPQVLAESVEVFAGLEGTLQDLRASGLRLAIYTGSRGESFLPLERAGLMHLFDPVITAGDVDRPKPHPEGLFRCLELIGCAPSQAVYVGDTRHDIEAGRAAGMRSIGVLTGAADSASLSAAGADRLVASHRGLAEILLRAVAPATVGPAAVP